MSVDPKLLYDIVGEAGPAFARVEKAMHWLISPEAKGIGQKLLEDAYQLHGRPVTIRVSDIPINGYLEREHTVFTNPSIIDQVSFGNSQRSSIERCLGHELVHATQVEQAEEKEKLQQATKELGIAYKARFTPEEWEQQTKHLGLALEAPDEESAMTHIARHVYEHVIPANNALRAQRNAHPDSIAYIKKYEKPAVEIENRIAAIRGEPQRAAYTDDPEIDPEFERQMLIDQMAFRCGIGKASKAWDDIYPTTVPKTVIESGQEAELKKIIKPYQEPELIEKLEFPSKKIDWKKISSNQRKEMEDPDYWEKLLKEAENNKSNERG